MTKRLSDWSKTWKKPQNIIIAKKMLKVAKHREPKSQNHDEWHISHYVLSVQLQHPGAGSLKAHVLGEYLIVGGCYLKSQLLLPLPTNIPLGWDWLLPGHAEGQGAARLKDGDRRSERPIREGRGTNEGTAVRIHQSKNPPTPFFFFPLFNAKVSRLQGFPDIITFRICPIPLSTKANSGSHLKN